MKRSELKQLIREAIADITTRNYPNEQNTVVQQYLTQLRDVESNYTDDEDDLKNLTTAVDLYHKELINKLKDSINESVENNIEEDVINEAFSPETDEVGEFWIVEKPSNTSTLDDICFKCENVAKFANQVTGGLKPEDIKGVFYKEVKAKKLAEKLLADRDKKKDEVKKQAEAYKKMKEETLSKVQEYMKTKGKTKEVVDELKDMTDK